jgi:hypothetical protein
MLEVLHCKEKRASLLGESAEKRVNRRGRRGLFGVSVKRSSKKFKLRE